MPTFHLNFFSIPARTAEEHGFKGDDEVALFAKVGSRPTHFGLETLAAQPSSDSVCRLLYGTALSSNTSFDEVLIRVGRIQSEYAHIPFSYLPLGPRDLLPALGDLTTFDFYVWNSCEIIQVPNSTGAAHLEKQR